MSTKNAKTHIAFTNTEAQGAIAGIVHQATRVDYAGEEDFNLTYAYSSEGEPTTAIYKMLVVVAVAEYLSEHGILREMEFGELLAQIDTYVAHNFDTRTNLDVHGFNENTDISDIS